MDDTSHPNYPWPSLAQLCKEAAADQMLDEHRRIEGAFHNLVNQFLTDLSRLAESPLGSLSKHFDMDDIYGSMCDMLEPRDEAELARAALDRANEEAE